MSQTTMQATVVSQKPRPRPLTTSQPAPASRTFYQALVQGAVPTGVLPKTRDVHPFVD